MTATPPDPATAPAPAKRPSLVTALILAALLFVLDALWLNQGAIAFLVVLWQILVVLPFSFRAKHAPVRRERLRNVGIYVAAALLVFAANAANNALAQRRAENLIAAVKGFEAQQRRYPASLAELVPAHLPAVPAAKLTLADNAFRYRVSGNDASLEYTSLPPFGRSTYSFRRGEWSFID